MDAGPPAVGLGSNAPLEGKVFIIKSGSKQSE